MKISIPKMDRWEQVGGDMNPGAHGGLIARSDGDALELREIQPVRSHVGDSEAAEVGFPFWSREGWYDLDALSVDNDDVLSALDSIGMSLDTLEADFTPTQRAMVIAEAMMGYGTGVEEGPSGWAEDVVPDDVKWWGSDERSGAEYLSDEDDEFRREVLLDDLDVDYESFGPDEKEPTSGLRVKAYGPRGEVEIVEWTDVEHATGEDMGDDLKVLKVEHVVDLDELFDPDAKHRGTYSGDDKSVTLTELAMMGTEERQEAVVGAAIAYAGYWSGTEEWVESIGD